MACPRQLRCVALVACVCSIIIVGECLQVEVPKALVGFVIGRNGEHINNIQNTCGVRLQFQNG
jgi:predicted PilT family ATPase